MGRGGIAAVEREEDAGDGAHGHDLVSPVAFGEDEAGEVYVVLVTGRVMRLDAVR